MDDEAKRDLRGDLVDSTPTTLVFRIDPPHPMPEIIISKPRRFQPQRGAPKGYQKNKRRGK
jgi:hypothetical protein